MIIRVVDKDLLAADAVAETAEDDAAHGAGNVADRVGGEGQDGAGQGIRRREEDDGEYDGGRGRVDREVVPLERGAGEAGGKGLVQALAVESACPGARRAPEAGTGTLAMMLSSTRFSR